MLPVVQSAISSFNNAALFGPSFFWTTVFMLPLIWLVTKVELPAWVKKNTTLIIEALILAWLILNGGNYEVLRDAGSLLPVCVAAVTFVLTASVVKKISGFVPALYAWLGNRKYKKLIVWCMALIVSVLAGLMAGQPTVFGILLQSAAVFCGIVVGRAGVRSVGLPWVVFAITAIILMQPEFFRFGQLGNLTPLHMMFMLGMGVMFAAYVALRNINPRGRIHDSAFVKLKWAGRIMSALCIILFLLTESVLVFFGCSAVIFATFAISVWHAKTIPAHLADKIWAAILCAFGTITLLPVITALGVLKFSDSDSDSDCLSAIRTLL